jgi:DegV family protein with EDD domain
MPKVKIITDSGAHLEPVLLEQYDITVLSQRLNFDQTTFREGVDITPLQFFKRMMEDPAKPTVSPPPVEEFRQAYERLQKSTDQILVLVSSSHLSATLRVAQEATYLFLGRCRIAVVDSQTTSLALGILVEAAARAAEAGRLLDDIVRLVRGMIPHIYVIFFAETLDYLERAGRIGPAQALLGTLLSIKPMLIIEDGEIIPQEKVRTTTRAVEKLFEFVAEFSRLDRLSILESPLKNDAPLLLERLKLIMPERSVPVLPYSPSLACHLGPDAMGVVVYEGI